MEGSCDGVVPGVGSMLEAGVKEFYHDELEFLVRVFQHFVGYQIIGHTLIVFEFFSCIFDLL